MQRAADAAIDPEDARLIAGFLAGEGAAVERISAWLQQATRSYRARLASWEDAQQDLLLEVARLLGANAFRGEARLKTYLWKVANHTCLNLLRSQARHRWSDLDGHAERLEAGGGSALDGLLAAEAARATTRLARVMPAECRRLWAMVLRGLSYRQMSERLGVQEGALRVRVHRCRKRALVVWEAWRAGRRVERAEDEPGL